jgi:hypothetical protein
VVSGAAFGAAKLATWWSGRDRVIDPAAHLEIVSERLLRRVDAKYIIFGHTHGPVARTLEAGRMYFNTGTWLPSGKPGLLSAFTHVVLRTTRTGPRADLCQWRDGASRAFTAGRRIPAMTGQYAPEPTTRTHDAKTAFLDAS